MKFLLSLSLCLLFLSSSPVTALQEKPETVIKKAHKSLEIQNLRTPIEGLLVGAQPKKSDIAKIKDLGFQTIITLRPLGEETTELDYNEQKAAEEQGMHFVRIPILTEIDLNERNLKLLNAALEAAGGKAFLHCRTGNRVGAMLAFRAFKTQKMPFADSIELGKSAGMNTWTEATENRLKKDR